MIDKSIPIEQSKRPSPSDVAAKHTGDAALARTIESVDKVVIKHQYLVAGLHSRTGQTLSVGKLESGLKS